MVWEGGEWVVSGWVGVSWGLGGVGGGGGWRWEVWGAACSDRQQSMLAPSHGTRPPRGHTGRTAHGPHGTRHNGCVYR